MSQASGMSWPKFISGMSATIVTCIAACLWISSSQVSSLRELMREQFASMEKLIKQQEVATDQRLFRIEKSIDDLRASAFRNK